MKKISLKTIRKSLNMTKGKEEGEFVMLQQPVLSADFPKEDSFFAGCYTTDITSCDLSSEEDKGWRTRSKGEGLMGTLRRRLSAKQKAKGKGSPPCVGSGDDDDTFSSASVPVSFTEVKAQRPLRTSSLHGHHYSPSPWPLRPNNSEVKVKAMVHSPSPSPSLNGMRKEFRDIDMEGLFADHGRTLKNLAPQN